MCHNWLTTMFSWFLDSIGDYHVWHGIVECALYRIPQTRSRLVLLASRLGTITLSPPALMSGGLEPSETRLATYRSWRLGNPTQTTVCISKST